MSPLLVSSIGRHQMALRLRSSMACHGHQKDTKWRAALSYALDVITGEKETPDLAVASRLEGEPAPT
jgi:hypothetical protein